MIVRSLFISLILLSACGGDTPTGNVDQSVAGDLSGDQDLGIADLSTFASQSIGAGGGTVTASDGTKVSVPAGALSTNATITVSTSSSAGPTTGTLVGKVYTFGPEGQTFSSPATVTLLIDPSKLPSGKTISNVVIFTAAVGSTSYTNLTTTVVDSTHVSAQTSHFSNFAPTVPPAVGAPCTQTQDCSGNMVCVSGYCMSPS